MQYNQKDVMKGLQQLMIIWNDPEYKQDIIILSNLLLKFVLIKSTMFCQLILNLCFNQFFGSILFTISKSRYILTEVEQIFAVSLVRKLIYAGVDFHPELILNLKFVFEIMIKRRMLLFSIKSSFIFN
ncbi:unnamed protein product [Paramecium sonneborni]|uniref:Uncharacterized protein n=1 Tax=Paramecium sonneborni TaxID=65129 RepID=A0A8S1RSN8_9CILI|nr:unnamed protein product [Paramecium sonneborni]